MDKLLSEHEQVFLVMPAKAAGTSTLAFVRKCTPGKKGVLYGAMIIGNIGKQKKKDVLISDIQLPSLIAYWLQLKPESSFIKLAQHATKKSLIIYIHREETDRLKSAIRHTALKTRKKGSTKGIQEEELIDMINKQHLEIGSQVTNILTCKSYDAIEDNAPNMVFIHYLQIDKLFKLLAKHHCPGQETIHHNTASEKQPLPVIMKNSTARVYMDDWLDAKINLLELGLDLKTKVSCQAKTRKMEADLLSCPDETLHISSSTFFRSA